MKNIVIFSVLYMFVGGAHSEPKLVGVDVWPPYMLASGDGIADKKAKCVFDKANIDVEYKRYPWARVYNMVMHGELQLSYGWVINEKRKSEVLFSSPMLQSKEYLVYLSDAPISWDSIRDLGKYKVGGLIGYSHLDVFNENGIKPATIVKSEMQLLEMLFAKRIDAFPITDKVLEEIKSKLPSERAVLLKISEKPFSESSNHIISTNNEAGIDMINKINMVLKSSDCD